MKPVLLALAIAAAGAAACAPLDAPLSTNLGQAVASMDLQAVPPSGPSDAIPESSGERAVAAVRRYEVGAVKRPPTTATSEIAAETPADTGAATGVSK